MGLVDFIDLANAQYKAEEEHWDREYQKVAWQTALLMNATGNFGKKKITPELLYKSPFAETQTTTKKDKKYVENEQQALKQLFELT